MFWRFSFSFRFRFRFVTSNYRVLIHAALIMHGIVAIAYSSRQFTSVLRCATLPIGLQRENVVYVLRFRLPGFDFAIFTLVRCQPPLKLSDLFAVDSNPRLAQKIAQEEEEEEENEVHSLLKITQRPWSTALKLIP